MSTTILEIPEDLLDAARLNVADLRTELAVHLYEQGRISFGKARDFSELDSHQFRQLLGSRGIPVHYGAEEYESDRQTIETFSRQ